MRYDLIAKSRAKLKKKDPKKYSLRSVASRIGCSHQLVSLVEKGDIRPSVSTLVSLCSELGLDINDVLSDELAPRKEVV